MADQVVDCVWRDKPAKQYMFRKATRAADTWEEVTIPNLEGVVYIRLVNEQSTTGQNLLVITKQDPPTGNPAYFTIWASSEKEWRINVHGIPAFIAVQAAAASRSYYYEYVKLNSPREGE